MSDEHRAKILAEVNKVVVGALFALLATSITGLYVVPGEMKTAFREHSRRLDAIQQQGEAVHALVAEMSPAAQRSADRVLEVASLDFRRTPTSIDRKAADQWHAVSVKARLAAAGDLAVLTKFGQGLPPEGEAIRRQIEETLRGEFSVWQAIDRFVEQRATGQNDNESFAAMDQALVEYRRLIGAHANVLLGVGVQFLRSESADNDETKRSFDAALGRSRAKLNWSLLGVVTAVVGLSCYCVYFLWPRLRSKPNEKKIVVVDR